ncbi:Eco57I restriction-modification methylase domain-containing protein [Aureimonas jatrophae]|uniref:site-specific DNA-methyltransferase (adenine-specific) n=1 Tax=Aureimonas jatrophae TaxID=1166073 RepID=A0A1H0M338_9HYPH|nr:N-6 DNA methylase [Aureimonas jatrophae]MBB3952641.1 hypothetical protein [Aureimonas jatrophae]SDO74869.1 N-6 DNA Methylase [Aureimonas jatrophae]
MLTVAPADAISNDPVDVDVQRLHDRCGVYTRTRMVEQILDAVGWTEEADLSRARLLEPAVGNGAFLVEVVRRLMRSLVIRGLDPRNVALEERVVGFELHDGEATVGRSRLRRVLREAGIEATEAARLAAAWLRTDDFLLQDHSEDRFTHVVGNPPYARWSKIPKRLRVAYESRLAPHVAKGDLFLPFLDLGIGMLRSGGRLGFLCSDRWQYMAFATDFRTRRLPEVEIVSNDVVSSSDVYEKAVGIYPSVLILQRRSKPLSRPSLRPRGRTLRDLGFSVRVGPALGCTEAFVLPPEHVEEVEPELLAPWVAAADVREQSIVDRGRRVICLIDDAGRPRDMDGFPKTLRWLSRFREKLERRSIVRQDRMNWFRQIDRVQSGAWRGPKLLVPELAKVPRVALDEAGIVPSHGIYAIVPSEPSADPTALLARLGDGGLARALDGQSPMVAGAYYRCYKNILERAVLDD